MRRAKQGAHSISFADAQLPGSRAAWSQNALTHLRRAVVLHERKHLARYEVFWQHLRCVQAVAGGPMASEGAVAGPAAACE